MRKALGGYGNPTIKERRKFIEYALVSASYELFQNCDDEALRWARSAVQALKDEINDAENKKGAR